MTTYLFLTILVLKGSPNHPYLHYFRNDGIIIAITVWQVVVESTSNVGLGMAREFIISYDQHKLILNLVQLFITYIILPSFYFLGDNRFRLALKDNGILRSIWTALKQKYEK